MSQSGTWVKKPASCWAKPATSSGRRPSARATGHCGPAWAAWAAGIQPTRSLLAGCSGRCGSRAMIVSSKVPVLARWLARLAVSL